MNISFENIWIPGLVLLPNLIVLIKITKNIPDEIEKEPLFYFLLEKIGQIGFFILPLFYVWKIDTTLKTILLIPMFGCLILYYFCWFRFLIRDCDYKYLYLPLTKLPIPMVLFPVLYLLFAASILEAPYMIVLMIIFSIGHFKISWMKYRQLKK
jgi:hypothetical protein